MATTVVKPKAAKVPKEKKAAVAKKPRAHPPYADMIKEAIASLKERTGSSQYAITKFIEDNQKDLSPLFKKHISLQLKRLVASGSLTKIKSSFKLSAPVKTEEKEKKKAVPAKPKKALAAVKPKKAVTGSATKKKKSVVKPKAKAVEKSKAKVVKAKGSALGKRKAVEKATPVKKVKSLKSPVKKGKK